MRNARSFQSQAQLDSEALRRLQLLVVQEPLHERRVVQSIRRAHERPVGARRSFAARRRAARARVLYFGPLAVHAAVPGRQGAGVAAVPPSQAGPDFGNFSRFSFRRAPRARAGPRGRAPARLAGRAQRAKISFGRGRGAARVCCFTARRLGHVRQAESRGWQGASRVLPRARSDYGKKRRGREEDYFFGHFARVRFKPREKQGTQASRGARGRAVTVVRPD
mmetsp:Transcript_25266/g.86664  ORF Transcript_25266/g.86664 Transcript_25266/m.86664 type:complete len:222 (+) Transcript_25266:385-1050(+)